MGIADDDSCRFCLNHEETRTHVFYDCDITNEFLKEVISSFAHTCSIVIPLDKKSFLFGIFPLKSNWVKNNIILLVKNYVYMSLMQSKKTKFENFKTYVRYIHNMEEGIIPVGKYTRVWLPITPFLI